MREILFRGKTKESGEWVQGYLVYAKSDFDSEECREADIIPHDTDRVYKGEYNIVFPCILKTIGQYTGLTDKNGKKIFEGDILTAHFVSNRSKQHFKVIFENGAFLFDNGSVKVPVLDIYCLKVIGSIHDNTELLEGEQ